MRDLYCTCPECEGVEPEAPDEITRLTARVKELEGALRQAIGWIDAWDCPFKDDPEWLEYSPQIRAAITQEKLNASNE